MSENTHGGYDTPSFLYRQDKIRIEDIWTQDPAMKDCLTRARRAAQGPARVLLLGETGTGKNLLAKAIHNESERKDGRFVALNAASLPSTVLEVVLLGSKKGIYTDATDRLGFFRRAHGGTLFIDEIGALPYEKQAALLHAVDGEPLHEIGSTEPVRWDVRLITATNLDLDEARKDGRFREDIYHRISQKVIKLPPLRDRPDDILVLAGRFLPSANQRYGRDVARISEGCRARMLEYPWPGNVRELRSRIDSAVCDCLGDTLEVAHVFGDLAGTPVDDGGPADDDTLLTAERRQIVIVLRKTGWNRARAAERLGISRPTLYDKMKKHGLKPPWRSTDSREAAEAPS